MIRRKIYYEVSKALKEGKILKKECAICGEKNTEAHHEDYSKPLEIIWLCPQHHKELSKNREGIKLKCPNKKCNHEWNYKGKAQFYTSCPRCLYKVKIKQKK